MIALDFCLSFNLLDSLGHVRPWQPQRPQFTCIRLTTQQRFVLFCFVSLIAQVEKSQ